MRLYYYIHLTGLDAGNSGIPRVVRNLGKALQDVADIDLLPVRWDVEQDALVHAENQFRENVARFSGPAFPPSDRAGRPIHEDAIGPGDWVLIPEAPHLGGENRRYPSAQAPFIIGYLKRHLMRSAFILHDILPLSHLGKVRSREIEPLAFMIYAAALATADAVFSVSHASEDALNHWLSYCGMVRDPALVMRAILLPEETIGQKRAAYIDQPRAGQSGLVEFCMWGTIFPHKNQIAVMDAFNDLCARRPDLNLHLHHIGSVVPVLVERVARAVRQSKGRIKTHGFVDDREMFALIARCRATIFLSLAEGYGLPLAESLWMGKPCLTSNIAPMTEIAKGGGCVMVDPADKDDIVAGLERLATDEALLSSLKKEILARNMKTWAAYASEIVSALRTHDVATPAQVPATDTNRRHANPTQVAPVIVESITFSIGEMRVLESFASASPPLISDNRLHFARDKYEAITDTVLCFGPYARLGPGFYYCSLKGALAGDIMVRIISGYGSDVHFEGPVTSLNTKLGFFLASTTEMLEVVIAKTATTIDLILEMIHFDRYSDQPFDFRPGGPKELT